MAGQSGKTDGRQSRWDRHNEERRVAILEAAIVAIEEAPVGGEVSVADIAARAGLSRTVLYRHFDDRADLDLAIRGRIFEHLQEVLLPRVTLDGTPLEIIRRIVGGYVDWASAHPALHRVVQQQPLGQMHAGMLRIAAHHRRRHVAVAEEVARSDAVVAGRHGVGAERLRARVDRRLAVAVDHRDLPVFRMRRVLKQTMHGLRRAQARGH